MIVQILIGALVVAITIAIHGSLLGAASFTYRASKHEMAADLSKPRAIVILIVVVLWLLVVHLLEIGVWAFALWQVEALPNIEDAVYFALVSMTALGYGDVVLDRDWRIMGALSSASGLLLFGWSTAYLVEFMSRRNNHSPIRDVAQS